jgi:hypothetical protein
MTLERGYIEASFRGGTADQRAEIVRACPPHPFRDAAATLSQSEDVVHRVMAMGILATAYCYGRACHAGAEMALAGHALGATVLRGRRHDLQPQTLSLLAVGAVSALRQLGRDREALAECERLVRYQELLDPADPNVHALRLVRVELLLELGRAGEAEAALAEVRASAGPVMMPGLQPSRSSSGRLAGTGTPQ